MAAPAEATPSRARPRAAAPARQLIWVDVAGAVREPGLYSLPQGARVAAAIQKAGGIRGGANRAAVNLAAELMDGQQIFVPGRGSHPGGGGAAGGSAGTASAGGSPAEGPAGPGSAGVAAGGVPGAGATGARISLSSATQAELETLDGIGPALAQRIIEYRNQHGGFQSIDELQQVSGIGEKRFQALKPSIAP